VQIKNLGNMERMKNPFDRQHERINHHIFESFCAKLDIGKFREEFFQKLFLETKIEIDKYIKENNPDLLTNFNLLYQEFSVMTKDFQKTILTIEKKLKKLIESSSLCEDVLYVRDELKVVKKKLDKLNSGIKKVFND
jgi:hypothetical protein